MLQFVSLVAARGRARRFPIGARVPKPLYIAIRTVFAGALAVSLAPARAAVDVPPASTRADPVRQLPELVVKAKAQDGLPPPAPGGQLAKGGRVGLLGNKSVMDTPFSVAHYTSEHMEDEHAITLAQVLNGDPSSRFTGQIGGVADSFYIRGFPINEGNIGELAFDGVYGVAPNFHLFTAYVERVEVLKGPGALLYGLSPNSGVGGVVNVVPKRPLSRDLTRLGLAYQSDSQFAQTVDVSRRFGSERQFGIRFNGLHSNGGTPLDKQNARVGVGALSLDYQGERLRASLDLIEQYERVDAPMRPFLVGAGVMVPPAPDGVRNVAQPWAWWKSNEMSTLGRIEFDVNENLTVFADAGLSKSDVARYSGQTPTILDTLGNTSAVLQNWKFQVNRMTADTGVRGRLKTGPVNHAIVVQANIYRDRLATVNNSGSALRSNIYAPVDSPDPNVPAPASLPKISSATLSGVAFADTLSALGDRVQLTLGVRRQHVQSENFSATTGARTTSYNESAFTPLAGIVFKPLQNVSLYANYIEGLSKGDIAPAIASNAGQVFAPYKTKQKELGVKAELGKMLATFAAFQITKPSGQLYGTTFSVDSEQRNQGLELSLSGELLKGVRVLGGITYIDAELTKTNSAATRGNRPIGVPQWMANVGADWDLPWVHGLTLMGTLNYTGREYVNQANTQSVPSWTTLDLSVRYRTVVYGKATTLRAGVLNLFDRKYWAGVASFGTVSVGAPRTLFASATVDF